jgi:nucleotide-binding universal stress UspA family protein
VGIDGSEPEPVLEFAAMLARRLETALVVVHATDERLASLHGNARTRELARRRAIADGERLLAEVSAPVRALVRDSRVEFREPPEALWRVADDTKASLILVSPRGRWRLSRLLWRATSGVVAAAGPCPVVIVPRSVRRGENGLAGGPIVVGSDHGTQSGRALAVAEALSDQLELPILSMGIDTTGEAAGDAVRRRNVRRRPGETFAGIANRVRATLLVVGTRGGSWLSGSVTQRLIGSARVPLVVVPGGCTMAEPIREPPRNRGAFGWRARVFSAIGSTALLVGVVLLVSDPATGVAWPLIVLGVGITSILLSQRNQLRALE